MSENSESSIVQIQKLTLNIFTFPVTQSFAVFQSFLIFSLIMNFHIITILRKYFCE